MKKNTNALRIAVLGVLASWQGALVHAQAPAADGAGIETIIVTGSRIPRLGIETPSPIQVIASDAIVASGYTSIADVLRDITANGMAALNPGFNRAFSGGASGVSLRGLTLGGTLVLIDGLRMAPYPLYEDGQRPFVDIASIPFDAVERIEIFKDGASAIYGSDAIAGVVNVILKKNFEGSSFSAEAGTTEQGGGTTHRVAATHGFGSAESGRSGFVALEYRKQEDIKLNQRSGEWTRMDWTALGGEDLRPGARNARVVSSRLATAYLQVPGSSTEDARNFAFYPGCNYAAMRANQCVFEDTWSTVQQPAENINLLARYDHDLANGWTLNLQGSIFNSTGQQVGGAPNDIPEGSFGGFTRVGPGIVPQVVGAIDSYTVPANYPGNTLGVPASVIGSVTPGKGPVVDLETQSLRLVAELSGAVGAWAINAAAGTTQVETDTDVSNVPHPANLLAALNSTDASKRYLLSGNNSAAVMDFVAPTVSNTQTSDLDFLELRATRNLLQLRGGALGLGLGTTYVSSELNAPNFEATRLGTMQLNAAYGFGKQSNLAVFAEVVAPVLESLELEAALRHDHYDTYGNSTTPKLGFKYSPLDWFSLRGTATKGFRAPAPTESGDGGFTFGYISLRDPLLCPVSSADGTPDLGAATNVPAQCSVSPLYLQSTTPTLEPETSKSYTLGVILEPLAGWTTTLDFFKTDVNDQILSAAAVSSFNPLDFIVRTTPQQVTFGNGATGLSTVGPISFVKAPFFNANSVTTSGVELGTSYTFGLRDYGSLTADFQYTHVHNYDVTAGGVKHELAGTHGPIFNAGDSGNPRNRAQLSLTWENGPLTLTTTTHYISRFGVTDPLVGLTTCAIGIMALTPYFQQVEPPGEYCSVDAFYFTNLSAQYQWNSQWSFRLNVTNALDAEPPTDVATYGAPGQNPSSPGIGIPYNPLMHQIGAVGRFYSVAVNHRF